MNRTRFRSFLLCLCALGCLLLCNVITPPRAYAETVDELIKLGNSAYESKKYREAISAYTAAIQADPANAVKAYRNMAFAYDQLKEFNAAAHYYDFYFALVPDAKKDREMNARYKRILRERGKQTPLETDTQRNALARLESSLVAGPYLDPSGGGAAAHYDVLMRTGFATPALIPLQKTLGQKLLEEATAAALPAPLEPVPTFGRDGWKLIADRVHRATTLNALSDDTTRARAAALLETATAWDEYLRGNHAASLTRFQVASSSDPTLLAASWGLLLATMHTENPPYTETLKILSQTEDLYKKHNHDTAVFVPLLRAHLLQRSNKATEAAKVLQSIRLPDKL